MKNRILIVKHDTYDLTYIGLEAEIHAAFQLNLLWATSPGLELR